MSAGAVKLPFEMQRPVRELPAASSPSSTTFMWREGIVAQLTPDETTVSIGVMRFFPQAAPRAVITAATTSSASAVSTT